MLALALFACVGDLACRSGSPAELETLHLYRTPPPTVAQVDLCVYGATPAGIAAAIQTVRMGRSVALLEPGEHIGGLTAGGLGATDVGRRGAIGGIADAFYRRIARHYAEAYGERSRQATACAGGTHFEPHVAELVLEAMLAEAGVPVYLGCRLEAAPLTAGRVVELRCANGARFRADVYIDASYEGDLLAAARVPFTVGRESNAQYGETLNGNQPNRPGHNFRKPVDPYIEPGDPMSGLLPGISDAPIGTPGEGDSRVQAYNYRLCLTTVPGNRIPFPKPHDYDPARYELLLRYLQAGVWDVFGNSQPVPNGKSDTNNNGAVSSDYIGANYDYPTADPALRRQIALAHESYQKGLLWFLANDPRVPRFVREDVARYGLARDEFVDSGGWPHQLYIREARRMVSDYVVTEANCAGRVTVTDSIGLASYNMDSHNVRRYVEGGRVRNEGDVQVAVPQPYAIPYRAILPPAGACHNLLVPVCLSASHIAFGSIRMEPVFFVLGQSAATAACLALEQGRALHDVEIAALQERLRADGQALEWPTEGVAPIAPSSLPGIVLDDTQGEKRGEWLASARGWDRRVGTGYLHDDNAHKGEVSIVYAPEIPTAGRYEIVLIFPPHENRATNVPVTVEVEGAAPVRVLVDQRHAGAEGFVTVGVYTLPAGRGVRVRVGNEATDGYVVADGIQFLPRP